MARQSPTERILPLVQAYVDSLKWLRRERLRAIYKTQAAFEDVLARADTRDAGERLLAIGDGKATFRPCRSSTYRRER